LILATVLTPVISVQYFIQGALICLVFCVTLLTVVAALDIGPYVYAALTLTSVCVMAVCTAFLQNGLFALAGFLPFRYIQAVMGGQGLGGMLVAVISVVSLAAHDDYISAIIYYGAATFIVIVCWLLYTILPHIKFMKHQLRRRIIAEDLHNEAMVGAGPPGEPKVQGCLAKAKTILMDLFRVIKYVRTYAGGVFLVFTVSLGVFPTVAGQITSSGYIFGHKYEANEYWVPIYCFLGFNLFDFIGRQMSAFFLWPRGKWVLIPICLRFAFFPLFCLCRYNGHDMSVFATDDAFPAVFMILVGISNGYFGSLCMILAPSSPTIQTHMRERAGSVMSLILTTGITVGTIIGTIITLALDPSFPLPSKA